jgi:hypothetical protein
MNEEILRAVAWLKSHQQGSEEASQALDHAAASAAHRPKAAPSAVRQVSITAPTLTEQFETFSWRFTVKNPDLPDADSNT